MSSPCPSPRSLPFRCSPIEDIEDSVSHALDRCHMRVQVRDVMAEESTDKAIRVAEMEANKASNMMTHQAEIYSRPARTWFQNEKVRAPLRVISRPLHDILPRPPLVTLPWPPLLTFPCPSCRERSARQPRRRRRASPAAPRPTRRPRPRRTRRVRRASVATRAPTMPRSPNATSMPACRAKSGARTSAPRCSRPRRRRRAAAAWCCPTRRRSRAAPSRQPGEARRRCPSAASASSIAAETAAPRSRRRRRRPRRSLTPRPSRAQSARSRRKPWRARSPSTRARESGRSSRDMIAASKCSWREDTETRCATGRQDRRAPSRGARCERLLVPSVHSLGSFVWFWSYTTPYM